MVWFKVDDKHHDHRKTRKALRGVPGKRRDAAAMGLWELAGSWCADNLTDGFVPTDELPRWDDAAEALAARLVDAELWVADVVDGEVGFRFVNWEEHQPMKETVEAKREAARERMRRVRETPKKRSPGVRANKARTSQGVRSTPSRPVPSPAAAAAAASDGTPTPSDLPPAVAILRAALEAHKLTVQWNTLTVDDLAEIERLTVLHGDAALVASAVRSFQPNRPPATAKAWLKQWRDLRAAGDLALVTPDPCPQPGHSGTTRHCAQCASEQKAANR